MTGKNLFRYVSCLSLMIIIVLLSGCSQVSLFNLLENEQEGDFSLSHDIVNIHEGGTFYVRAQGGFLPYTYRIVSSPGTDSIDPVTGEYTAPPDVAGGLITIEVEGVDQFDNRDTGFIRVYEPLAAAPVSFAIRIGDTKTFTVTGGYLDTMTYTVSAQSGVSISVIDSNTFEYYPPPVEGYDYIEITDELNNSVIITVEILLPGVLNLQPAYTVVLPNEQVEFTISGGSGSYTAALSDPSIGSIPDPLTNPFLYTAPSVDDTSVILTVTDTIDATTASSDIYIVSSAVDVLELSPSYVQAKAGTILEFTASGGIPPYTFSILSGAGILEKISPTTMLIETISPPPLAKIRVTDNVGNTATANIDLKEK